MIQPDYIDLPMWAASLRIDFPEDDIPELLSEKDWKEWGDTLVQCDSFSENNAPGTAFYPDWVQWARDVYFVMYN